MQLIGHEGKLHTLIAVFTVESAGKSSFIYSCKRIDEANGGYIGKWPLASFIYQNSW